MNEEKKLILKNLLSQKYLINYSELIYKEKKNKKLKFILLIIFFFIISLSIIYLNILGNGDFYLAEKYYRICNKGILLNKINHLNIKRPKISIISAVYNKENYIKRFLRSIQNQNFNDIEIILVDDCSTDNTIKIIEKFQRDDRRIILIKHSSNKGTLISRNNGVLKSRGEYLIIPDPDDILLNNILNKSYILAKKKDFDIIRFDACVSNHELYMKRIFKDKKYKTVYQPILSSYIFYSNGNLMQNDYVLWNKLIKRNIYVDTLNYIPNYYLKQNMITYEDGLINFILHKKAKSFYYSRNLGYYYLASKYSNTIRYKNMKIIEKLINNNFLFLKFIFLYTNNNKYEKNIFLYIFNKMKIVIFNERNCKKIKKSFNFYNEIINLFLTNKLISLSDKRKFKNIKKLIKQTQNKEIINK